MSDIAHRLMRETTAAQALLAEFSAVIADDQELKDSTIEGATNWHDAVLQVMRRIKRISGLTAGIKIEQKNLRLRKERFERQDARLRASLHKAMTAIGQTHPVEFDIGTLSKPAVPNAVVWEDEAKIPGEYWLAGDPVLDKSAVRHALNAGEKVPGARLETNRTTIRIIFT